MAFTKIGSNEISGTGTIADAVAIIADTAVIEAVGLRSVHVKSQLSVSGAGSVLTIDSGYRVEVATRMTALTGAIIVVGSIDAVGANDAASMWFNSQTPGGWTDGAMDSEGTGRWEVYNSQIIFNTGGNINNAMINGFLKTSVSIKSRNSVFFTDTKSTGTFYLTNLDSTNTTFVGGVAAEFVNNAVAFENVKFKNLGTTGLKIYASNVTIRGAIFESDCSKNMNAANGKLYTVIDTIFTDSKVLFEDTGSRISEFYSINSNFAAAGVAQVGINAITIDNESRAVELVTDSNGDTAEVLQQVYFHNNSLDGGTFSNRNGEDFRDIVFRAREFGKLWSASTLDLTAAVQINSALVADSAVTQTSAAAAAHTGITVTDHGIAPVTWQSLSWGITVEANFTTNPALTVEDIKHFLHYSLSDHATFAGKTSGLEWHDFAPMSGISTTRGAYQSNFTLTNTVNTTSTTSIVVDEAIPSSVPATGEITIVANNGRFKRVAYTSWTGSTFTISSTNFTNYVSTAGNTVKALQNKGVRIVDENGDQVTGFNLFTADDGTTYAVPKLSDVSFVNLTDTTIEIFNDSGTSVQRATAQTGTYLYTPPIGSSGAWSAVVDRVGYNRLITTFGADNGVITVDGSLDQLVKDDNSPMYSGGTYPLVVVSFDFGASLMWLEIGNGIATAQQVMDASEDALLTVDGMLWQKLYGSLVRFNDITGLGKRLQFGINIRLKRSTAGDVNAEVAAIISSIDGIVVDGVNGGVVFGNPARSSDIALAVRSELTTELGRIDVANSTRLATVDYSPPPAAADIRTEIDTNSTKLISILEDTGDLQTTKGQRVTATGFSTFDPALQTVTTDTASREASKATGFSTLTAQQVWEYATRALTDKAGFSLTPAERDAIATVVEAHLIDEADGQTIVNAIVGAIGNSNVDELALVAAIRADLERAGGTLKLIESDTNELQGAQGNWLTANLTGLATAANVTAATAATKADLEIINTGLQDTWLFIPHTTDLT
jgi:hypothetical protein